MKDYFIDIENLILKGRSMDMKQEIIRIDLGGVNCYLGKEKDNFVLFDTGGHLFVDKEFENRREKLEQELIRQGCNDTNLKLIVLTHGDNDHATNAAYLRDKFATLIAMHQNDVSMVDHPSFEKVMENNRYNSIAKKVVFFLLKGLIKKLVIKTLSDFESFQPDILLEDGDDLSSYGFGGKVIHIPGHTNGSIGIVTEEGDFISGDTLTNTTKPNIAPNAADFRALKVSVNRIKEMKVKMIYPGHGAPFSGNLI